MHTRLFFPMLMLLLLSLRGVRSFLHIWIFLNDEYTKITFVVSIVLLQYFAPSDDPTIDCNQYIEYNTCVWRWWVINPNSQLQTNMTVHAFSWSLHTCHWIQRQVASPREISCVNTKWKLMFAETKSFFLLLFSTHVSTKNAYTNFRLNILLSLFCL